MVRITLNGSNNFAIFNEKFPDFFISIYQRIRKFTTQRGYGFFICRLIFGCIQRGQRKNKTNLEEEKLIPSIHTSRLSVPLQVIRNSHLAENLEENYPTKPPRGIIRT